MEWVKVNDMLKDEITKLNHTLIPPGYPGDVRGFRIAQESLGRVIDSLGEQSAKAQGLSKAITTAEKLRNAQTHVLYVLKDAAAHNGDGEVIGFLKVSYKHLYLFDERDKECQVEPLCVLDFYVSTARQRRGCGRKLFDYMLQDTGSRPHELAVDGPSAKMETFLAKNYGIQRLLRQSNNFAVAPQFFQDNSDKRSGRSTPVAASAAVGRYAARKPPSAIADVIHGGTNSVYSCAGGKNGTSEASPEAEPEPEAAPEPPAEAPAPSPEPAAEPEPSPERPTTLRVEPAPALAAGAPSYAAPVSPAGSTLSRRDSQLTDRGFFDVKFYHNKLW